ncbi:hypothetical protein XW81_00580 [Buchnera aphidicola (Schlechtendalia chinensis)]|uniref:Core domain-containing protein n=1 Tax=Buchnera aphidicola subsp. Schlechtendalia chinensis TaxID=118110 RepID=A0A172WD82_BUCSC|nr:iron-sulfur cluster assembly accessory protein [Buchnera aphidicola]ANF16927.1 hypothetical protein XW81_00580 [Buchnera aphidicola (Schlechtendalia chinensis)]
MTNITISCKAIQQIQKLMKKENKIGIKLGIKKSGCAGMKYYMKFIKAIDKNDVCLISNSNIIISAYSKHVLMLNGTKIDFEKEGLNYNFKFKNKKIKDFCGCGESFNI